MAGSGLRGLLCIGDPHLASRVPGFRRDDYPRAILGKLAWCLEYARERALLPAILGDLFHWPRDNANWLLGELMDLFADGAVAVAGNHDHREDSLGPDDSLSVLARAGRVRLLDEGSTWTGEMGGRPVIVGGTPWGGPLPERFDPGETGGQPLVVWLSHHLLCAPGITPERGMLRPREIHGIDLVVNGHVHTRLEDAVVGTTTWCNPGNISRYTRSATSRARVPSALRVDVGPDGLGWELVEIPHSSFDEVFFEDVADERAAAEGSAFVAGLADLVARRTGSGAGLAEFLDRNLDRFDDRVAAAIRDLAEEVLAHGD